MLLKIYNFDILETIAKSLYLALLNVELQIPQSEALNIRKTYTNNLRNLVLLIKERRRKMDNLFQVLSPALLIAVSVQVLCQLFKAVFYSIQEKKLALHYLFSAGGMPSAHSAFVTSLSIAIGLLSGFNSELFALAFVFSAIIIHDSFSLRGTVQIHSRILQKLALTLPAADREHIPMRVGHTIPEIVVGVIAGIVLSPAIFFIIVKPFLK